MPPALTEETLKFLFDIIEEYNQVEVGITPTEFIEKKLFHDEDSAAENEAIACLFLKIYKQKSFLENALEYFCDYNVNSTHLNKYNVLENNNYLPILFYIVIFELNETNVEEVRHLFEGLKKFSIGLMKFFKVEENMQNVVIAACKVYDNDYVMENIAKPLVRNQRLLATIYKRMRDENNEKHKSHSRLLPIPTTPVVLQRSKNKEHQPLVEPSKYILPFVATELPISTYIQNTDFNTKLEQTKNANMKNAIALLQESRKNAFACSNIKEKKDPEYKPYKPAPARAAPKAKCRKVKTNTTTVMRQAALLVKNKEEELKKIYELMSGAYDTYKIEAVQLEMREDEEQRRIQEIERKHLEGLLTHEESILAKKKLMQSNQEKIEEFQRERAELIKALEKWREQELEKNKGLITKAHDIEEAARESERRLLKTRQCNVKLTNYENRRMLDEAQRKKHEELEYKIRLIQEFRALQMISTCAHFKEFDKTESANLGLLCEMSIAELSERLNILKINMKEELDRRRLKINEEKRRQQEFLENVKEFIAESKKPIAKPAEKEQLKLQMTPEIVQLRERLKEAKIMRLGSSKCPYKICKCGRKICKVCKISS